jgi:Phosphate-selective porin O and P
MISLRGCLFLIAILSASPALAQDLPPPIPRAPAAEPAPPSNPPAPPSNPPAPPSNPPPEEDPPGDGPQQRAAKGHKHHKARITGFMQMFFRYGFHTGEDPAVDPSNFRVQRVRIALDGKISPSLTYKISFDPRAPEIGGVLRDAYVDVKNVIPYHRIRAGQQKTIFGYENDESSTRLFAVNRAEISDNLGRGISLRDLGVSLIGRT